MVVLVVGKNEEQKKAAAAAAASGMVDDEKDDDDGDEAFCNVVLYRFHPLLRRLCETVQSYGKITPLLSSSNYYYQDRLENLALISDLLNVLQNQLESLRNYTTSSSPPHRDRMMMVDERKVAVAIRTMADFLTLPLRAILRSVATWEQHKEEEEEEAARDTTTSGSSRRTTSSSAALQSAIWKCVARASRAMQTTVELMSMMSHRTVDDSLEETFTKQLRSYLAACAAALPGHEAAVASLLCHRNNNDRLDSGEACLEGIYGAAECIVTQLSQMDNDGTTGGYCWGPDLVRLLDIAVTLLEPPPPPPPPPALPPPILPLSHGSSDGGDQNQTADPSLRLQGVAVHFIATLLEQHTATGRTAAVTEWQRVFPATYAALYRRILHATTRPNGQQQQHGTATTKVAVQSLHCLTELLRITLTTSSTDTDNRTTNTHHESSPSTSSSSSVAARLKALSMAANNNDNGNDEKTSKSSSSSDAAAKNVVGTAAETTATTAADHPCLLFVTQAQRRLPVTLHGLANLMASHHRPSCSVALVLAFLNLCRVVLVDISMIIIDREDDEPAGGGSTNPSTGFRRKMLEYVMVEMQQNDDDADRAVPNAAKTILTAYNNSHNNKVPLINVIGPRMVELVDHVSVLAQSGRPFVPLEASLKLLQSYMAICEAVPALRKTVRAMFSTEPFTTSLRRTFLLLYDVDFATTDGRNKSGWITVLDNNGNSSNSQPTTAADPTTVAYRYLPDNGGTTVVDKTVAAIGRLLGRKHTVLLMDACFSEMVHTTTTVSTTTLSNVGHNNNNHTMSMSSSLTGQRQVQWLHEWIGLFRFLRQLWRGAALDESPPHQSRYLRQLALAMVPVLVSSRLWALPTTAADDNVAFESENSNRSSSSSSPSPSHHAATITLSAIHGNTVFTTLMMGFVGDLIQALDRSALPPLLPTLLPRLIEKSCYVMPQEVQRVSDQVLESLAVSLGYRDLPSLLLGEMESSFIPYIMSMLRLSGGQSVSKHNCCNANVKMSLEMVCVAFQYCIECDGDGVRKVHTLGLIPALHGLIAALSCRFDHMNTLLGEDEYAALLFARFLKSSIVLCQKLRESLCSDIVSTGGANHAARTNEPWFELLTPFRSAADADRHGTSSSVDALIPEEDQSRLLVEFKCDTDFVGRMAWRLGYLMSHPSLRVQRIAFDCLERSFRYLGWIAFVCSSQLTVEETNGPKTAVLRQIHTSWSAIQHRMNATCESVAAMSSLHLTRFHPRNVSSGSNQSASNNGPEQRYVLASLFTLVATMCEASDDFMASRWRPVVWPCLSKIIQGSTGRLLFVGRRTPVSQNPMHQLQESERLLLLCALDCLRRTYRHRPTGVALAGLIPTIGSILLPLLDHHTSNSLLEMINDKVAETIESLIAIDGDALYRPLVELTGGREPQQWTRFSWDDDNIDNSRGSDDDDDDLALAPGEQLAGRRSNQKAFLLLQMIESQPEQVIW